MSSHCDYTKKDIQHHDAHHPFAPENGYELKFKVGDDVIFTNDAGLNFKQKVTGFYKPENTDVYYATGGRYFLDTDAHWVAHKESELRLARPDDPDRF